MKLTMSERTAHGIAEVLAGTRSGGLRAALLFAGPAVVASIAYMDPGNFATNIQAGSTYGYRLLWVALLANLIAMLFQSLSAKLGIATGRNLAEHCRDHYPRWLTILIWIVSEIAAMATDLAEFLGGAIGLSLLFNLPIMAGMILTGLVTYAILLFERKGFRPLEIIIGALAGVIALSYVAELFVAPVQWRMAALGTISPQLPDRGAITIAVGMIGATVMPHALYLHSGLTQARAPGASDRERGRILRFSNREVIVALTIAGLVNMAMVMMAASAFHDNHSDVASIETAYHTLAPLLGRGAAGFFLMALIASGVSSSVVGTMAGQLVMQSFVGFKIPVWFRRLVTMAPAFAVVASGADTTDALVYSQVVLSLALPFPMLALVLFTRRPDIMGAFVNGRLLQFAAAGAACIILILNAVLVLQVLGLV